MSLGEYHGFLPWNSTICIIQTHLVFDNVVFSFLLQTQKFYINLNRKKGKGKKKHCTKTSKQNHIQHAIYQKSKSLLFCGTICIINVYGITIKHKHIPCQTKWHHNPLYKDGEKRCFYWNGPLTPLGSVCSSFVYYVNIHYVLHISESSWQNLSFSFPWVPSWEYTQLRTASE